MGQLYENTTSLGTATSGKLIKHRQDRNPAGNKKTYLPRPTRHFPLSNPTRSQIAANASVPSVSSARAAGLACGRFADRAERRGVLRAQVQERQESVQLDVHDSCNVGDFQPERGGDCQISGLRSVRAF